MQTRIYRFKVTIFAAALSLFFIQSLAAQVPSPLSAEQISAKVDEYMQASAKSDHFSGSILVARDGRPVISKGYGMANYELDVPNTPGTIFRLGSITKQFTAAAILQLQEKGKLNVGDPICKYLENCPAAWQPVTIKNLLTHTGGIPNYTAMPDFMKTASLAVTNDQLVARFRDKPLDFAPGEKFKYSNSGYHLLGMIVEKASGKSYAAYLQENVFTPLGMKHSGYDVSSVVLKNRAAGYDFVNGTFVNAAFLDMSIPYAAGSLYSTTGDLLIWDQALNGEKVLSKKSLEEMFTPFKENYADGWSVTKYLDHRINTHNGGIFGFATYIARFPDDKVTIIVLNNNQSMNIDKIGRDLASIVFAAPYDLPQEGKTIAPEILKKYVGDYELGPNFILTVTFEDGKLMTQATGQQKIEIFAESETVFFPKVMKASLKFETDAAGTVTGLTLTQGGRVVPAKKIRG